jgi:inorganic phosphate transporter, PiT family
VIIPALISPLLAGLVALIATYLAYRITVRAHDGTTKKGFKVGQIVSASMVALAHGTNDAQKTMGIITLTLITAGALAPNSGPPFWVILSAGLAIALGTYVGGWRRCSGVWPDRWRWRGCSPCLPRRSSARWRRGSPAPG